MTPATGPLVGIRVVEFNAIGPVPLAGMLFADMGADVIRIARPRKEKDAWEDAGGATLHRSRCVVELDLKNPADLEKALALIARADALIEGQRPCVMERLGLGPQTCLALNPRLVYGRMTGWGQAGPLAQRAGHDINFIALTGALHAIGPAAEPPAVPLNLIGDYGGGAMFLVTGVLAALLSAKATGKGQVVDAAMIDGVATMTSLFRAFRSSGQWSNTREANLLDGGAPYYRCYTCADGKFIAVGALEPQFYAQLLAGLGLPLQAYPQHDRRIWPTVRQKFAEIFASKPRNEWEAVFANTDACVTPVLGWDEAPEHPHHRERGTYINCDGTTHAEPAPRFSGTPSAIKAPATLTPASASGRWAADA